LKSKRCRNEHLPALLFSSRRFKKQLLTRRSVFYMSRRPLTLFIYTLRDYNLYVSNASLLCFGDSILSSTTNTLMQRAVDRFLHTCMRRSLQSSVLEGSMSYSLIFFIVDALGQLTVLYVERPLSYSLMFLSIGSL